MLSIYTFLVLLLCHIAQGTYVVSWGGNAYGQLGIGNTTTALTPTLISAYAGVNLVTLRVGLSNHFAMMFDGSVYCSGNNFNGQLGINSAQNELTPILNTLAFGLDVYPIGPQTIAFNSSTKNVYGWGENAAFMVSVTGNQKTPAMSLSTAFMGLAVGVSTAWSAAFVNLNGGTYVAGAVLTFPQFTTDTDAKLGIGATADQTSFVRMPFWDNFPLQQLFSTDSSHVCGLTKSSSLYCWGRNDYGQLGLGHTNDVSVPNLVSFFDDNQLYVAQLKTGDTHTVALTCGGKVYAWGSNFAGNLGIGTEDNLPHTQPILVHNATSLNFVEIVSAVYTVFARNTTNHWHVWGATASNLTLTAQTANITTPTYNPYFTQFGLTSIASNSKSSFAFAWVNPDPSMSRSSNCPPLEDECAMAVDNCATNTLCVDTERSYECICGSGFSGDGISPASGGTGCNDINECLLSMCVASASCDNQLGSFYCTCPSGFQGDGKKNGTGCTDINECTDGGWCPPNTDCTNTIGSYLCACSAGYRNIGESNCGIICTDINECITASPCSASQQCTNTPGSYNCTCLPGYEGASCTDIDECTDGLHDCVLQSDCVNSPGSFSCQCPSGFTGNAIETTVAGGTGCLDINECTNTSACDPNATCANSVGSYKCTCNSGYQGSGLVCTDINECANSTQNNCVSSANNGTCTNTPGSYVCGCLPGFSGNGVKSGTGCTDINECTNDNTCSTMASCTNTQGSYICTCLAPLLGSGTVCYSVNCTLGFYPNTSTTCAKCPAGTYNDQTNVGQCTPCPAGTNSSGIGKTSSSSCVACAKNTYSSAGSSQCTACPLGSTSNGGTASCTLCPAGQYGVQGSCKNCGQGLYSSAGATDCIPCPPGTFASALNATSCSACTAGSYSTGKAASCSSCSAGKYTSSPGQYFCSLCPSGTSTNGLVGASSCSPCAAGLYASAAGSASCQNCTIGTYSSTGSDICLGCSPGAYQDTPGQASCKLCNNWQYADTNGATACGACYQGFQGEAEYGSKNCLACPAGTFRTTLPVCTPCYPGSANEVAGMAHCTLCMGGFYARKCGQLECDPCAPGTYSSYNATGQANCPYCIYGEASFGTAYFCYY